MNAVGTWFGSSVAQSVGYSCVPTPESNCGGLAYAIGRFIGKIIGTVKDEPVANIQRKVSELKPTESKSFGKYYSSIFYGSAEVQLWHYAAPGVDETAGLFNNFAADLNNNDANTGKYISFNTIIASAGKVVLSQAEQNALAITTIVNRTLGNVFQGSRAPLDIENDPAAVEQLERQINATKYWGIDGEEGVGGWPKVTRQLNQGKGYEWAASLLPLRGFGPGTTIINTSPFTELSKTLTKLAEIEFHDGVYPGKYFQNLNAIFMAAGCFSPEGGCDAPANATQKTSESNIFFDIPAAQNVFALCQRFGVPVILVPRELSTQAGMLWTKQHSAELNKVNNSVANQMAQVTAVPEQPYAMPGLISAMSVTNPNLFNATKMAISIDNSGQFVVNRYAPEELKNVYVLNIAKDQQSQFYPAVIAKYKNFNFAASENGLSTGDKFFIGLGGTIGGIVALGITAYGIKACFEKFAQRKRSKYTHLV